ncbi:MerR family transcriptional regulator [Vibrio parahaemolyticus]|uniref:MerR family transcriptional regulator n=1 Tax=Vibrio mediterranei TaxID=689 RepID=UPI0040685161
MAMINIREAAAQTKLTTKAIRYYEDKGVILSPARDVNGYRIYSKEVLEQLTLVSNARKVGFSIEECKELVELAYKPTMTASEIKEKAHRKVCEIQEQIDRLSVVKAHLQQLVDNCPGDNSTYCPIVEEFKSRSESQD